MYAGHHSLLCREEDDLMFPMEDEEVTRRSTDWVCCPELEDGPGQSPGNKAAGISMFGQFGQTSSLKRTAKIFYCEVTHLFLLPGLRPKYDVNFETNISFLYIQVS